jgi:tetratricopeptide (TPR) repeat protein
VRDAARHAPDGAGVSTHTAVALMFARLTRRRVGRILLAVVALGTIGLGGWAASRPVMAEYHERQAAKALERQRYARAQASFERALTFTPDSARLHLLAARAARQARDDAAARRHIRRCRELQGGVSEEQQLEDYLLRAQTGEVDEVAGFLTPYLSQEGPLTPLVLEGLTRAYMGKYRSDLAWKCLTRWNELQPTSVEAHLWLGVWHSQQQNTRAAGEEFRRALDLDPERIDIRLTYAEILRAERATGEIAEQYRLVLGQAPQNRDALLGLARAELELGRAEEARRRLEALPADEHESADYLWVSGMVELQSDHPERAEPLLRRALERDPRNMDVCYNLVLCLSRLGRESEAAQMRTRFDRIEREQKRLIELTSKEFPAHPYSAELRCELAELYMGMGLRDRGVHWLRVALKLDPTCRRAHELLRDYYLSFEDAESLEKADYHRRQLAAPR